MTQSCELSKEVQEIIDEFLKEMRTGEMILDGHPDPVGPKGEPGGLVGAVAAAQIVQREGGK